MNGLLELAKLPYLQDKFVVQVPASAQLMLLSFIEEICLNYESKIKDKIKFVSQFQFALLCIEY